MVDFMVNVGKIYNTWMLCGTKNKTPSETVGEGSFQYLPGIFVSEILDIAILHVHDSMHVFKGGGSLCQYVSLQISCT